jgi:hypothetical protein
MWRKREPVWDGLRPQRVWKAVEPFQDRGINMPRITCEYCNQRLAVPMALVGKQTICPACHRTIPVMPARLLAGDPLDAAWRNQPPSAAFEREVL